MYHGKAFRVKCSCSCEVCKWLLVSGLLSFVPHGSILVSQRQPFGLSIAALLAPDRWPFVCSSLSFCLLIVGLLSFGRWPFGTQGQGNGDVMTCPLASYCEWIWFQLTEYQWVEEWRRCRRTWQNTSKFRPVFDIFLIMFSHKSTQKKGVMNYKYRVILNLLSLQK